MSCSASPSRGFGEALRRIIARPFFWLYTLIVLLAGGTSFYLTPPRRAETPRPKLEMPEFSTTDLGEGEVGQVLTDTFSLRNRRSATLEFQLQAGCACTELAPMQGRIEPGEVQSIHVGIRLRYRGKQEVVTIHVQTNDPETPAAAHTVVARNVAPFVVSPAVVDFGTVVDDGKLRTTSLRVLSPDGKPLPADVTVTAVSDRPHVVIHPDESQPGERSFRVTLRKGVPRGYFTGTVKLRSSNDTDPYDVPVVANVCGPIVFAPQTVYLPQSVQGPGKVCNLLVWRPDGKPLGKLVDKQVPAGILVQEDKGEISQRQRLRIAAASSWDPADFCQIRLRFEIVPEDVVVKIRPRRRLEASSGMATTEKPE